MKVRIAIDRGVRPLAKGMPAHLRYVLEHIADHPIGRINELVPWNVVGQLQGSFRKCT